MTRSQRELAHLALDPAGIAAAVTEDHAVLENFVEDAVMKGFPQLRGE